MSENVRFKELIQALREKGKTLGSVESMTAGLFAASITSIPGASDVYKGSLVTYSPDVKERIGGVSKETLERFGPVSWPVAREMAIGGRKALNADLAVSVTGNAGPTAEKGGTVGDVFVAVTDGKNVWGLPLKLEGDREKIRSLAIDVMVDFTIEVLKLL